MVEPRIRGSPKWRGSWSYGDLIPSSICESRQVTLGTVRRSRRRFISLEGFVIVHNLNGPVGRACLTTRDGGLRLNRSDPSRSLNRKDRSRIHYDYDGRVFGPKLIVTTASRYNNGGSGGVVTSPPSTPGPPVLHPVCRSRRVGGPGRRVRVRPSG